MHCGEGIKIFLTLNVLLELGFNLNPRSLVQLQVRGRRRLPQQRPIANCPESYNTGGTDRDRARSRIEHEHDAALVPWHDATPGQLARGAIDHAQCVTLGED